MYKIIITILLLVTNLFAMSAKPKIYQDYHILAVNTDKEPFTALDVKKALIDKGFTVTSVKEVHVKEYKSYHIINFLNEDFSKKTIERLPQAGLFHPLGMAVYQKTNDPYLWIAILSSRANSKVLNLKGGRNEFASYDRMVISALLAKIKQPRFEQHNSSQKRQIKRLDAFEIITSKDGKDEFAKLRRALMAEGMTIDSTQKIQLSDKYDFFYILSFHQKGILENLIQKNPEAGAYFPAPIILYKEKSSPKAIIMQIDASNIIDSSDITDTKTLRTLINRQAHVNKVLKSR